MRDRVIERDDPTPFLDLFTDSKSLVKWNDDEYQQFANQVWDERRKRPFLAVNKLYERAQARLVDQGIWAADRLRQSSSIASAGNKKVETLLIGIYREAKEARDKKDELRRELERVASAPKKNEILDSLEDEEVMAFYGQRVLEHTQPQDIIEAFSPEELLSMVPTDQLLGYATRRLTSDLLSREIKLHHTIRHEGQHIAIGGSSNDHSPEKSKSLPRIAIVGATNEQFTRIREHFLKQATFTHVERSRLRTNGIPDRTDMVVTWSNFAAKAQKKIVKARCRELGLLADRTPIHCGGFNALIEVIEGLLT